MDHLPVLITFGIFIVLAYWFGRRSPVPGSNKAESPEKPVSNPEPAGGEPSSKPEEKNTPEEETKPKEKKKKKPRDIKAWSEKLSKDLENIPTTRGLIEHPKFQRALEGLRLQNLPPEDLVIYLKSDDIFVAMLSLHLAAERDDLDQEAVRSSVFFHITYPSTHRTVAALQCLPQIIEGPCIGPVIAAIYNRWNDFQIDKALRRLVDECLANGEPLTLGDFTQQIDPWDLDDVKTIIRRLPTEQAEVLLRELADKGVGQPGNPREILKEFCTILDPITGQFDDGSPALLPDYLETIKEEIVDKLTSPDRARSVLLTGERRVGKTALTRLVARDLQEQGYLVVTATSANLQAGQSYIGELEQRVTDFLRILRQHKIAWIAESFQELELAGRHRYSSTSILDMILPHLERGQIVVLGEAPFSSLSKLKASCPRIENALEVMQLAEPDETQTLALAADWINEHRGRQGKKPGSTTAQLAEGLKLARQYSVGQALPGLLLDLLKDAFQREANRTSSPSVSINRSAFLRAVAAFTGMPMEIIDDARSLDLAALEEQFAQRVMAQPEAVAALLERVAMIKAGLTDPTRPLGVFLFAGPTGTGKTEIAKTLATFLFGSEQRMIRFDMSEFQDSSSLTRLVGSDEESASLASRIRAQPFSLVLLDEFEKAHYQVWDLFLQVFDDGRLTDSRGNTADLRNTIIILTSNLGARDAQATAMGFNQGGQPAYRPHEVQKAIDQTFRKEFVNRIDRIVTFRPLARETMREILRHQLQKTLSRRGLRNRPWVIEWDESATEFLLDQGFSPTMGARPLLRAMDRFLLGPLAREMVNGSLPPEEQLLFIYAREGRLHWDSSLETAEDSPVETEEDVPVFSNRQLVLNASGTTDELQSLAQRAADLEELLNLDSYLERKEECLQAMQDPEFWHSPQRWELLALAEYIDRVESSLKATTEIIDRLLVQPTSRPGSPEKLRLLVSKQAQRLFLLENAYPEITTGESPDALIVISAGKANEPFATRLREMFRSWASFHAMSIEEVDTSQFWAARVNGFGALTLLQPDHGQHDWMEGKKGSRWQCEVHILPIRPGENLPETHPLPELSKTARRYQEVPTPLVIDKKRNYRTGRIDLVLKGHFDLIST
jgi:ATP-dependent Clp protease ATP-binding subunit ClpC